MTLTAMLPVRHFAPPVVSGAGSSVGVAERRASAASCAGAVEFTAGGTYVTDAAGLELEVIGRRAAGEPLPVDAAPGEAVALITDVRDAAGDPLYRITDRLIRCVDGTWCIVANVGTPRPPVATVQTIVNDTCPTLLAA